MRLEYLGCMRNDAGSLTIPKTSHLSERQKDESPQGCLGIVNQWGIHQKMKTSCYNHSLLPSLPFLLSTPCLSSQPSLVPCTNCFSFTLGHPPSFQHTQVKIIYLHIISHASIVTSFIRSVPRPASFTWRDVSWKLESPSSSRISRSKY